MEDLIDAFASSQVTAQCNSTYAEHPHFSLYKVKSSSATQEERRRKFLDAQKQKRFDYATHARKLATSEWDNEENEELEEMDYEECIVKPPRSYKNQLMLSEWLVEIPPDLATQWLLVLCPVGKRCLVVSSRGSTKAYSKGGCKINFFQSSLPGGQYKQKARGDSRNSYCLLDCIYNELEKTYYILDVMCWNSHPCFDSETEFRFYWLHSKIQDYPNVKIADRDNPYKFIPLPHFNCDSETIKKAVWDPLPFEPKLDGLLFYHKKTHYTSGTTPLVGWLKAYMLPEILNIEVPNLLCADKPASYVSMQQHIPEAFLKNEQRKKDDETNMQYEDELL